MTNRDMKNYRAPESVHVTRITTYLIIAALIAMLSWTTERDSYGQSVQIVAELNHEPNP